MSTSITTDVLRTVYEMDPRNYNNGARQITGSTQGLQGMLGQMPGLATAATAALAIFAAGLAATGEAIKEIVEFSADAFKEFAKQEALEKGLRAVLGPAVDLKKELKELRDIARLPGLDFQDALRGETRLVAAGLSAREAKDALRAFGNAIATSGGGKAELDGVTLALTQIASKGKVSAEEINQLSERVFQIRPAMKAAFGTADTEAIQKMGITSEEFIRRITAQLALLPKVAGGAQNSMENLESSVQQIKVSFASGFADDATKKIDELASTIDDLVNSGVVKDLGDQVGRIFGIDGNSGSIREIVTYIVAGFQTMGDIAEDIKIGYRALLSELDAAFNKMLDVMKIFIPSLRKLPDHVSLTDSLVSPTGRPIVDLFNKHVGDIREKMGQEANNRWFDEHFGGGGKDGKMDSQSPIAQTAQNTAKLVQIQEKALNIQRMTLGGGDLLTRILDPATLAAMKGRQAQKIIQFTEMVMAGAWSQAAEHFRRSSRAR